MPRPLRQAIQASQIAANSVEHTADLIASLVQELSTRGLEFTLEIGGREIPVKLCLKVANQNG